MTEDRHGRCPFDAGELIVFVVDVAAVGHSAGESIGGVRSLHLLLYNRECTIVPYLARQLSVLRKPD